MKFITAQRLQDIEPFQVMSVLARAHALEAQGRSIVHMEIGEPDFPIARPIAEAAIAAIDAGHTRYLPALGLPALRGRIACSYPTPVRPDPERVVITPGASGALQLVLAALLSPGDEVLLADPGYPCNRHFVRLFEGKAVTIAVDGATQYQLTAELIREHWTAQTVAVLISSPSNPTGTVVPEAEMARIIETVDALGGRVIVDEIYGRLCYDAAPTTVLQQSQEAFVINSFSKYYGMTGWRVGWLVAPQEYISAIDKLAQNIFIATSSPAQYAALAAFEPVVEHELQQRVRLFKERRDFLLPALRGLGFEIAVTPPGAFYLYADCSALTHDSQAFALDVLERAGVAITPGRDFGRNRPEQHVRFSYANTLERLEEGVRRLAEYLR